MIRLLGPLALLIVGIHCTAQVPYFRQYTLLRKNEPVQVNKLFQDHSGFIWIGTNKGLFRFDGLNYRRFSLADSLPDENVTAIGQDSTSRIWLGHKNGKLSYIEKDKVHVFEPREGSASGQVSDILFDHQGNLWYSTFNDGLYYFSQDRLYRLDDAEGLPDLFIYDIEEDPKGNIWVGTDGGVAVCTLRSRKVDIRVLNYSNGLPDNIVRKLESDESAIWMGTEDAGLIRYEPSSGKHEAVIPGQWHYGTISDFLIDGNQIWISSIQSGLVVYDRKTGQVSIFNSNAGPGLASISTLLKDEEGNVWAGSRTGVIRTPGDQMEYIENLNPSLDVNVVAVTVDQQGAIWFSTAEGLFRRTVDDAGNVRTERKLLNTPYQKYSVISLYADAAGYVWAGLYGEGALRIGPENGKIRYLNAELRNGNILSIAGKGNHVWLATLGGGSEIKVNGENLTIKNYGSDAGLSTDYIYQVFVDSKNRVWFATDGKGIDMLDSAGFHHFQKGLASRVVYGFAEDGQHRIWANVQGEGLFLLENGAFRPIGKESKLRDNNINGFAADQFGNLVVMHDLGIDEVDVTQRKVRFLGEEVGIRDKKANLNAVGRDDKGNIYFGTDRGIVKYASRSHANTVSPRPIITSIKAFDQPIEPAPNLHFAYDQNDITLNFLGLWYQNPENLNFEYRLENYDRDWIDTRDHAVTYSSLPPGTYWFRIRASETTDFSNAKETSIQMVISPPFWRTSWFYLLCAVIFSLSVYAFVRFRERQLQQDKKILEARVHERTEEIQRKTEEIRTQAEEIKGINENLEMLVRERTRELERKNQSLEEYAFINAHELRAPVASILGLINLMRTVELRPEERVYLEHLQKSAEKLDGVCSSITRAIERGDQTFPSPEPDETAG